MVGVAQLVEHLVVVQEVAGSSPVTHPKIREGKLPKASAVGAKWGQTSWRHTQKHTGTWLAAELIHSFSSEGVEGLADGSVRLAPAITEATAPPRTSSICLGEAINSSPVSTRWVAAA